MSEAADDAKPRRQVVVRKPEPTDDLTWQVGEVSIARCLETVAEMSPRYLLPDLSHELVAGLPEWAAPFFTPDGMMLLSVHSFVVQSGELTVVVDTCIGDHSDHSLAGDAGFVDRLAAAIPGGLGSTVISRPILRLARTRLLLIAILRRTLERKAFASWTMTNLNGPIAILPVA